MATVPSAAPTNQGTPSATTAPVPLRGMMAKPIIGYPRLSNYMGQFPEVAIVRRFGNLGAQNLLYLQCELLHLEHQLRQVELADSQSNIGQKSQYAVDWFYLNQSELDADRQQLDLFRKIRKKLRKYSKPGRITPTTCVLTLSKMRLSFNKPQLRPCRSRVRTTSMTSSSSWSTQIWAP